MLSKYSTIFVKKTVKQALSPSASARGSGIAGPSQLRPQRGPLAQDKMGGEIQTLQASVAPDQQCKSTNLF